MSSGVSSGVSSAAASVLGRELILAHRDARIGRVKVAEMQGEICVASLTAGEADKLARLDGEKYPATVGVVILGACDDQGVRLFSDADAAALTALPASAMKKIADAVMEHNGLSGEAAAELKND